MQTQRIVLGLAIAIGGTGVIAPASSQEYRGTWEQQMACTPDVWRLCGDQIPDVSRIVACLRYNTPQLSPNCRAVFESQADARPAPRGLQQNAPRARAPQPGQPLVRPRPVQPPPYYEEDY
ncbi:hypothetical protein [Bradyrhizobium hereditatis]|uniref:hypothetical protein n=1 Tax=Bradyrhizobium hereditatis TaxID=2821405 RepID=UPI001CE2AD69|nr:hypothetical protein [Bradyrhizobium hereditatis]